jgi:hypothetical protein
MGKCKYFKAVFLPDTTSEASKILLDIQIDGLHSYESLSSRNGKL